MSEQKSSLGVKQTACRAQKQVCIKPHIWGRVQNNSLLHWRVTESCSLSYPQWKKFETTRTLPRAGLLTKLSNWWRRALVRVVTKNLMVTLVELDDHICRWEKPTEGQTSLQHSTDLGFMLVWPNSILSSVKTKENTHGIYKQKAPKGLWKTRFSGLINLNSKHNVWREPALLITCRVPSQT